ncbi:ATP-binding cassette domain-containing protein [Roseococcus sp. SYP-B2431]|uniref:ABC transporter ATP-binding protein n=1 Tax=Roseococcus sp. SYP-B2431 TaxID=2496640 RepID=UPI00103BC044|nr:oligopeptide/dipeptide ABC transporter ATP-binding protein [Roseococcus sp. SYP-B2431]TCI00897.1 ATP-binding cassette domain-containing protein [Roseococcus sp. SYP-B2431]
MSLDRPAGKVPLLELEGLVKHFPFRDSLGRRRGAVHAVDGVTLAVPRGSVLAIVGESGCGKSTLGRVALRLVEPDAGSLRFDGEDLLALRPAALRAKRREMQLIFQDPFASLDPRMTVEAAITEPLILHRLHRGRERARVAELLERVGLRPELARRWPHEFSGGQRQRIAIARALASEPRLVIGDEPVSALDVSVQAQVVNLLGDLIRDLGLTFVLISHDLGVVRQVADRVAVMYLGRIVEEAPAEQLFLTPRHPYTRALLAAVPGQGGALKLLEGDIPSPVSPPSGCRFRTRCPHAQALCAEVVPELMGDAGRESAGQAAHLTACHFQDSLPPATPIREAAADARLARLQSFFSTNREPTA